MSSLQKLLSLTACLILSTLAMLTVTASADTLPPGGKQQTVTGVVHVSETNASGDVMKYTVTPPGGEAVEINVEPPNPGATADINSHNNQAAGATAKYHTTGNNPPRKVHEGFLT